MATANNALVRTEEGRTEEGRSMSIQAHLPPLNWNVISSELKARLGFR
jgi:hypothetical protein